MHGSGRVGGHELQQYLAWAFGAMTSVGLALFVDAHELARVEIFGEEKIDEPCAGHFHALDDGRGGQRGDDGFGDRSWRFPCHFGEAHRDIRREVTV